VKLWGKKKKVLCQKEIERTAYTKGNGTSLGRKEHRDLFCPSL
jgi:hypothetical protein